MTIGMSALAAATVNGSDVGFLQEASAPRVVR